MSNGMMNEVKANKQNLRLDIWMENQSFTVLSQPDLLVEAAGRPFRTLTQCHSGILVQALMPFIDMSKDGVTRKRAFKNWREKNNCEKGYQLGVKILSEEYQHRGGSQLLNQIQIPSSDTLKMIQQSWSRVTPDALQLRYPAQRGTMNVLPPFTNKIVGTDCKEVEGPVMPTLVPYCSSLSHSEKCDAALTELLYNHRERMMKAAFQ
ncbi:hypothetical protein MJG53_010055 [Ovis ammon polii x Ovis aries]|uniref:Uncharacterized protein n=1 Tax=Ovis ammon polii x Ovis aries TaxID=2918886 RepID=A0ACB9UVI8_9CETA|nr:hypothetical protein MJG53_010055 [Ovis ammon polii x Ovis aries]